MKKTPKYSTLIAYTMVVWGSFLLSSQFAHAAGVVVVAQSHVDQTYALPAGKQVDQDFYLGSGYVGTTTGAFLAGHYVKVSSADSAVLNIIGYSDDSYTSSVQSCAFYPDGLAINDTDTNGFVQLEPRSDCVLNAQTYYKVTTAYSNFAGAFWTSIYGTNSPARPFDAVFQSSTGSQVIPSFSYSYFSLVGNGFQIVPDTNSSGLFLSGAKEFCNAQFGTSTGIVNGLANDFGNAICQSVGYLFVPTQQSIQQFQSVPDGMKTVAPFTYFYQIADIFSSLQASTSQNMQTYSINLSAIDFGSSTAMGPLMPSTKLEFLGTTSINRFLPAGYHDILYNMAVAGIWVEVGFLLYRKVVPARAKI